FSAKRAKDAGLIDRVGVKSQAKAEVQKLAKVTDPSWKEKDKLESFMEQFATKGMMQLQNYFYGLKSTF
ncbi:MAG: signal peptide peptidase SppA, partial [Sulfurovum sp.]|nr:signal peptide peptidase SppA [Sulfurovum sp.]